MHQRPIQWTGLKTEPQNLKHNNKHCLFQLFYSDYEIISFELPHQGNALKHEDLQCIYAWCNVYRASSYRKGLKDVAEYKV